MGFGMNNNNIHPIQGGPASLMGQAGGGMGAAAQVMGGSPGQMPRQGQSVPPPTQTLLAGPTQSSGQMPQFGSMGGAPGQMPQPQFGGFNPNQGQGQFPMLGAGGANPGMGAVAQALSSPGMTNPTPAQYQSAPPQQHIAPVNTAQVPQMPQATAHPTAPIPGVNTKTSPVVATRVPAPAQTGPAQTGPAGNGGTPPLNAVQQAAGVAQSTHGLTGDYMTDPNNSAYQIAYDPGKGYAISDPTKGDSSFNVNGTGWSPTLQSAENTFTKGFGNVGGAFGNLTPAQMAGLTGMAAAPAATPAPAAPPKATAPATKKTTAPATKKTTAANNQRIGTRGYIAQ